MNRSEFSAAVAKRSHCSKALVETVLDAMIAEIREALMEPGTKLVIKGFGQFEAKQIGARVGRNPATGETIKIPPRIKPTFKPSTVFTAVLNGP
jgi:nucleoid DNA-binding protein